MPTSLPDSYRLHRGSGKDGALLLHFMYLTYQELFPQQQDFSHLQQTVARYLSYETPWWWVERLQNTRETEKEKIPVGCLWMGNAIDQVSGDRYSHIFLVYVAPEHRRQGIAKVLMEKAQNWSIARGDRQIGLQVFPDNQAAIALYRQLGYHTHSLLMLKRLEP